MEMDDIDSNVAQPLCIKQAVKFNCMCETREATASSLFDLDYMHFELHMEYHTVNDHYFMNDDHSEFSIPRLASKLQNS